MPFKNILIPTDFFEGFEIALNYAKMLAECGNSTLHILHVIEPSLYPSDMGFGHLSYVDLEKELMQSSQKEIEKIAKNLEEQNYNVKTSILFGRASDQIIDYSKNNNIDLICITTTGRNSFDRFIFGSTTEKVLRKAECPVLSIKIPIKQDD
jgi:universal stress protein A